MKIINTGGVYILTSALKVSDIVLLEKNNPKALKLVEDDQEKLTIAYTASKSRIDAFKGGNFGLTFGGQNQEGNAQFIGAVPPGVEKPAEYIADEIAGFAPFLEKLEQSIPEAAEKAKTAREELLKSITNG